MDWFADEEFWRATYPYMFPPERMEAAAGQVEQVLALAGVTGGAVLDLCCGPGRHSVEFARRGFAVTGVDRSPFLSGRARERALEAGVAVEWVLEDMRRFRRPGAYDLACSMFTSFGYFESEADDLQVLRNLCESLKPGGVLVMEMIGLECLARMWEDSWCEDYPDGMTVIKRACLRDNWTRVENDWILLKDGRSRTFHFEHSLYSARDHRNSLWRSGFADVRIFGDLAGSEYGISARRLVSVARKAPAPVSSPTSLLPSAVSEGGTHGMQAGST